MLFKASITLETHSHYAIQDILATAAQVLLSSITFNVLSSRAFQSCDPMTI